MEATYGKRIRETRKKAGMTQIELAQRSGIALSSIRRYERGVRDPRLEALRRIAVVLDVTVNDLVEPDYWQKLSPEEKSTAFDEKKASLLLAYDNLNETGQQKAVERVEELAKIPDYQNKK